MIHNGMTHGHFDVQSFETPGLTQEKLDDILGPRHTRGPGTIDSWLAGQEPVQKAVGGNLVFDHFAAIMFQKLFGGASTGIPFSQDSTAAFLATINFEDVDAEPTYTETAGGSFISPSSMNNLVATTAWKRFIDDDVEAHLITSDPDGREAINIRSRWLFLPLDFNDNDIRSLAAWWCADGDGTAAQYRHRVARIRLKDSGGSPIIINKTANQSLFVEYNFTLVSV